MTNTKWRISGGIGEPDTQLEPQKMLQGLGFPLRPVAGAPLPGSGDFLENFPIAEGLFMQWQGNYQSGVVYPAGSVVLDAGWTMVALVLTIQKAAPVPEGNPTYALPTTPLFVEQSNVSVVYSGHLYEFSEDGWVSRLRVWVPELSGTTNYRIVMVDITDPSAPVTSVIDAPILTENAWATVVLLNQLIFAGTKLLVYIDALNTGGDTQVVGGWNYGGSSGNVPVPAQAQWTKDNTNLTVRVDKTDLDTTDRTAELGGIIPNSTLQFVQTDDPAKSYTFRVAGTNIDGGTYFEYPVALLSTGPLGGPDTAAATTMTATVPVAQATKYVDVAGNPSATWATITPYVAYDGVDQGATNLSLGVDLEFDAAVISPDWAAMASAEL